MKIVADENIGLASEAFSQFGDVRLMPGRTISRAELQDADALVVRSITRVDSELLEGTSVGFVGTATIGTDHIDFDYLEEHNIAFVDAAGGGARSVAEYVVAALLTLREHGLTRIEDDQIAIVGVGAIGTMAAEFARILGMKVIEHDPPRAENEPEFTSASLYQVFASDIILLAVPLTREGKYATYHLVDYDFLRSMKPDSILINIARGGVVTSDALRETLERDELRTAVLDVWETEPEVPVDLLEKCVLATPHIAGYSQDGKLKGTEMMAEGLARFTGVLNQWSVKSSLPGIAGRVDVEGLDRLGALEKAVRAAYDIQKETFRFREIFSLSPEERKERFDLFRKGYQVRREFTAWSVVSSEDHATLESLKGLGFAVEQGMSRLP